VKHALLSPSGAERWIHCPPSARLGENITDEGNDYQDEGTDAHTLCEHKLQKALGKRVKDPRKKLKFYDQQMEEATDDYVNFCMEELERINSEHGEAMILVEHKVRYDEYVNKGSGTADCVIVGNGEMAVIDFKYGMGVPKEATDNPQLKLYALGCLLAFDGIYDIKTVKMCIYQPRIEKITMATVTKESLYQWADEVVKPAAELAWDGKGELCAGEHCQFCKVKARCRAWKDAKLELTRMAYTEPPLLDNADIAEIYATADEIIKWLNDVKEYATAAAIKGEHFPGFKVVLGNTNRKYTDETAIADRLLNAGYRDIYQKPKLLGLGDMTKKIGKAAFGELLEGAKKDADGNPTYAPLVEKPPGKPTLVPESDKRPEIKTAADVFDEEE